MHSPERRNSEEESENNYDCRLSPQPPATLFTHTITNPGFCGFKRIQPSSCPQVAVVQSPELAK
jgi:hypothetical protein